MAAASRAFVLRQTRLRPVPGLEAIRCISADEVLPLWGAVQLETGDPDAPLPYWAFAWGGGLAIARYLREHPEAVAGRRVFDLASGSGIGRHRRHAGRGGRGDRQPTSTRSPSPRSVSTRGPTGTGSAVGRDVLDEPPPDVEVVLAGDCWYEAGLAERVLPWLQARPRPPASTILIGDPGRATSRPTRSTSSPTYEVRTTTELEDLDAQGPAASTGP